MIESNILLIAAAVLLMAALYSTVGHGGGSGYLAVLAVAAIAPEQMRPTALLLNVAVSSLATWRFCATGTFRKELFIPLICVSIPAAFVGGYIDIPGIIYKPIVGLVLLYAAIRLFVPVKGTEESTKPNLCIVLVSGIVIGFASGINWYWRWNFFKSITPFAWLDYGKANGSNKRAVYFSKLNFWLGWNSSRK